MATVLYTPQVLALAVELAQYPLSDAQPLRADARSASCGSVITLGLGLSAEGRIDSVGVRSQACAIGQAAAAIFAEGAKGLSAAEVIAAGNAIAAWLSGEENLPAWPKLEIIAAARAYPARHGAVMLPWKAAERAFSSPPVAD